VRKDITSATRKEKHVAMAKKALERYIARKVFPVDSHPEIDFIWTNLERASLSPPEGLAGGESKGQGELRLGEAEGNPLGWGRGFGFFGERSGDFGGGERWCWWRGGSGPLHDWEGARSQ
jgi:hypothetical protein